LLCDREMEDNEYHIFVLFFFDPSAFSLRLPMMGLHGHTFLSPSVFYTFCCMCYVASSLIQILFDFCLSIFFSVFLRFLYLILMMPMLLLLIWSYPSVLPSRTTAVCVSVSFVPVSLHLIQKPSTTSQLATQTRRNVLARQVSEMHLQLTVRSLLRQQHTIHYCYMS